LFVGVGVNVLMVDDGGELVVVRREPARLIKRREVSAARGEADRKRKHTRQVRPCPLGPLGRASSSIFFPLDSALSLAWIKTHASLPSPSRAEVDRAVG
jgi:hypothetical protein